MSISSFCLFAPLNGFKAYRFDKTGFALVQDDSYALSSSELELTTSAEALRIQQVISTDGSLSCRISFFKQVFELGGTRFGHSCGIAFDINDRSISAAQVFPLFNDFMQGFVNNGCIDQGVFQSKAVFDEFCQQVSQESSRNLFKYFDTNSISTLTYDKFPALETKRYCLAIPGEEESLLCSKVAMESVDKTMLGLIGLTAPTLTIYSASKSGGSISGNSISSVDKLHEDSINNTISTFQRFRKATVDFQKELVSEKSKIITYNNALAQKDEMILTLKSKISFLENEVAVKKNNVSVQNPIKLIGSADPVLASINQLQNDFFKLRESIPKQPEDDSVIEVVAIELLRFLSIIIGSALAVTFTLYVLTSSPSYYPDFIKSILTSLSEILKLLGR